MFICVIPSTLRRSATAGSGTKIQEDGIERSIHRSWPLISNSSQVVAAGSESNGGRIRQSLSRLTRFQTVLDAIVFFFRGLLRTQRRHVRDAVERLRPRRFDRVDSRSPAVAPTAFRFSKGLEGEAGGVLCGGCGVHGLGLSFSSLDSYAFLAISWSAMAAEAAEAAAQ